MQLLLKTILNSVEKHKSFVYKESRLKIAPEGLRILVRIAPRRNSHPICSGCGEAGPGYDQLKERKFQYVPLWGIAVFFLYRLRRVDCKRCGVKVERIPWSKGKSRLTNSYKFFLADWAKRLSWHETARVFHTSWETVFRAVRTVVRWGLEHRDLRGIKAIGVDEIQYRRGHKYLTLVYQIDGSAKRLLYIAKGRTKASLRGFFKILTKAQKASIEFVASDMCRAYVTVIRQQLKQAIHVLDRFHIVKMIHTALDKVRAAEVRQLKAEGYEPVLTNARWSILKRRENLTEKQTVKLKEILRYNLKTVRSLLMKEDFNRFWEYRSVGCARRFLNEWCTRALRSKIEPMKKVARSLRRHEGLILNWFRAQGTISSGAVEGLNNKLKVVTKKAYGFRTFNAAEIALYHTLGNLPVPETTHRFS
jgi:transposase